MRMNCFEIVGDFSDATWTWTAQQMISREKGNIITTIYDSFDFEPWENTSSEIIEESIFQVPISKIIHGDRQELTNRFFSLF